MAHESPRPSLDGQKPTTDAGAPVLMLTPGGEAASAMSAGTGQLQHRGTQHFPDGSLAVNSVSELGEEDQAIARAGQDLFSDIEDAFRTAVGRGQAGGEFTSHRDAGEQVPVSPRHGDRTECFVQGWCAVGPTEPDHR